jgi:hypothetical protein
VPPKVFRTFQNGITMVTKCSKLTLWGIFHI